MTLIVPILIAVVVAFLAFRLIAGMAKFAVLALVVLALIYFLYQGGGIG